MNRIKHRLTLWLHTRRRPGVVRRSSSRTRHQPGRLPVIIACSVLVFVLGVYYINTHLRPIMTQMAQVQVDQIASRVINQSIAKRISEEGVTYNSLVYFEKDIYGQITALKTDIISINRLKSDITEEVLTSLQSIDSSQLAIPLGNLINSDLLSGRGPKIRLKIVPLGTVNANFQNQFSAAGINQTRHQIMMDISVDISVLLPGYSISTQVATQVSIAETVIVGTVPDSYFQFDGTQGVLS